MIESNTGIKIEFTKLDEWVVRMTVTKDGIIVATPIITINSLKCEIAMLEQSQSHKPKILNSHTIEPCHRQKAR